MDLTKVNYVDEGVATSSEFDLAITEFDSSLLANINFRSPDAFKSLVTTAGVEELRAVLHYQKMQEQILLVAVRHNQVLLDTAERALLELDALKVSWNALISLQGGYSL